MQQMGVMLDPMRTGSEAKSLEAELRALVVGQDEAIEQIVNVYQTYLTGLISPGRPIGNFLFLGPTGSGKTRIVEATAESLARNPRAVIKIDCAEFQHSHEIAKLIGSSGVLGPSRDARAAKPGGTEPTPHRHDENQPRTLRRDRKGERLFVESASGHPGQGYFDPWG